ncbi:MAG: 3-hydroxyisobutyrate dehydrogenase family protein [uncultured Paraburkholderia sp.]|nr:MAG: 3-hydroxyisobutyrate dehydrogenase family protein [uncultured Paraburkholderia sp.]
MEIGFCGPGLMGAPMIRHLLRAGHTVHVWNRTRAKAEALAADGAKVVDTPRELAGCCDAVLLCLAGAAAVEQTVFGPAGLLDAGGDHAPRRVRWIVDHSSIPPAATRALARRAAEWAGEPSGESAGESALRAGASAAPEAGAARTATGREAAGTAVPAGSAGSAAPADTPAAAAAAPIGWIDAPVSGGVAGAQAGTLAVMAGGAAADVEASGPCSPPTPPV